MKRLIHLHTQMLGFTAFAFGYADPVDCAFRQLALTMSSANLGGSMDKLAAVSAALNISDCAGSEQSWIAAALNAQRSMGRSSAAKVATPRAAAGLELFVSPTGSDSAAGTLAAPLKTLAAAQARLRTASSRGGAVVNVRAGTYYESLVLGPSDSGVPGSPVTWQSYNGEAAVVSGGDAIDCAWKKSTATPGAWTCVLPANSPPFTELFYGGKRLQRARWPNGDPSVPCNDAAGCITAGYTAAVAASGVGRCAPNAKPLVGGPVVTMLGAGATLTSGIAGLNAASPAVQINVSDKEYHPKDMGAFENFQAFSGGGVACYNNSLNEPYWNAGTCNCKDFGLAPDAAARAAKWKNASTGVVHMFHSARWGNWQFEVDSFAPGPPHPSPTPPGPSPGPPPAPLPGFGALQRCTSCMPGDKPMGDITKGVTLAQCQSLCVTTLGCSTINFAVEGDHACALFAACTKPDNETATNKLCANGNFGWWTLQPYAPPLRAPFAYVPPLGAPIAGVLKLTRGGWQTGQQGPSTIGRNSYYVSNIEEELDAPGEFFLRDDGTLTLIPPSGGASDPSAVTIVAALRPRVIQLRGASPTEFAHDITLRGLTIKHSQPTYLESYEIPSGGDWAIHRGGAVFLDGTEDVILDSLLIEQPGGNGIFLSNHAWRTAVTNNVINGTGDSAIVLVGSTELMNGTRNTYPAYTNVTGNVAYNMGFYGKQVAAVFKSMTYRTLIEHNVFFNSARSLVNYNDAFRGGDVMRGNVLFGAVTETADHASFNSWDRQSYFWKSEDGGYHVTPEIMAIKQNLILNKDFVYGSTNSDWSIDHDDASSYFEDSLNVMVYGAHKWRDGVHKWYYDNLYVL